MPWCTGRQGGKSQTIANLINGLAAVGRRVLFVAGKRAAQDVVLHRLDEVGLSHLSIDLHGADLSPKQVMQQVAHTLDMVRMPLQSNANKCTPSLWIGAPGSMIM